MMEMKYGLKLIYIYLHYETFKIIYRHSENLDWGAYQLDTMIDREDLRGNHFLVVTNFGDHILHHLFPTLDHGYLKDLYPILYDTVNEFSLEARSEPWSALIKGQHQQLARIVPSDRLLLVNKT